jgi:hypothetical protein
MFIQLHQALHRTPETQPITDVVILLTQIWRNQAIIWRCRSQTRIPRTNRRHSLGRNPKPSSFEYRSLKALRSSTGYRRYASWIVWRNYPGPHRVTAAVVMMSFSVKTPSTCRLSPAALLSPEDRDDTSREAFGFLNGQCPTFSL